MIKDMEAGRNFRQTVAKFGNLIGMPLSVLGGWLPKYKVERDFRGNGGPARGLDRTLPHRLH